MRRSALAIAALLLTGAAMMACSGGDKPKATPTAAVVVATEALATSIPETTASATTTPSATATPAMEPQRSSGVWLFDARTGAGVATPGEAQQPYRQSVRFGPDDTVIADTGPDDPKWYDYEGNEVSPAPPEPIERPHCERVDGGVEVDARFYAEVDCGETSPSGRWMTYRIVTGQKEFPSGYAVDVWDQWVVDLETEERQLLQEGLVHCGGCDGRFGPGWSPDERFMYFSELVSLGRVFLSDLEAGTTQLLFEGSTEVSSKPGWSPDGLLVHPGQGEQAVLDDPAAGTSQPVGGMKWPACFDPSGRLLFGPPVSSAADSLALYDIETRSVVVVLPAEGSTNGNGGFGSPCPDPSPVVSTDGGFVALLSGGPKCSGAVVYRGSDRIACIGLTVRTPDDQKRLRDSLRTVLSPDGATAAIARLVKVGAPPPCTDRPCGQATIEALYQDPSYNPAFRDHSYEVLLVNTSNGAVTMLVSDASSTTPPQLIWNDAGTHLLVHWPFETVYGP